MSKKCSTAQKFIWTEMTTYRIGTLVCGRNGTMQVSFGFCVRECKEPAQQVPCILGRKIQTNLHRHFESEDIVGASKQPQNAKFV